MNNFPAFRAKTKGPAYFNAIDDVDRLSKSFVLHGASKKKDEVTCSHPLEYSEKTYHANLEEQDFLMLRSIQGLHAPLRLQVERKLASRVKRLDCLPSSNVMINTLTGKLDSMDFQDVFSGPVSCEMVGQPHMLMEKQLGIL